MEMRKVGMGWLPDYPDIRDYTFLSRELMSKKEIQALVSPTGLGKADKVTLPESVDLRRWCSPVDHQGMIGSCTAQAGVSVVEYYENRAFGKHIDASRLFLYKATRNLAELQGDTGAFIRSTMGALVLFGVPPEKYWPYTDRVPDFDQEPSAFCYSFAENYKSMKYFRHDAPHISEEAILGNVKKSIAAGVPAMFGFTVYSSLEQAGKTGRIPFPTGTERILGGHAVAAVGYDDEMEIRNTDSDEATVGALLVKNSWGEGWGDLGYGWLPYDYVLRELAMDFWSILKQEWVDTGQFVIR
ncbi:MAG: cysteine protease [Candidatus Thermoplasmatota archaeon]|nr:cysteine protease [Candidatus Thermoplasmatota archaeon]